MNRKFFTTTLITLLALLLIVGGVTAQDPEPEWESKLPGTHSGSDAGNVSIAATVNSRISYQGVLKEDGNPVTGTRDMVFQFYTQDDCSGTPVESVPKNGVQVTDGLFDVELDVTHSDFNGQGLWLAVEVGGTAVGCREIMPVPYALSLRPGATIAGSDGFSTFTVRNSSSTASSRAIRGYASAATGITVGVNGRTESSTGGAKGVFGYAGAASGQTHGVAGQSLSTSGRGAYGYASAASGTTYGVYGLSSSPDGYGVYGYNDGGGYAGYFEGDVAQSRAGNGLVKAAARVAPCGTGGSISRSFNNVGGTVSFYSGGAGYCIIDFGFQIDDRFWVATAENSASHNVTCIPGSAPNRLNCHCHDEGGSSVNSNIMVLVY